MSLEEITITQTDRNQLQQYYNDGIAELALGNYLAANEHFKQYHQYKANLGSEVGEFGYQIRTGQGPLAEFVHDYTMTAVPALTEEVFNGQLAAHFIQRDLDWISGAGNNGNGTFRLPNISQFISNEIAGFQSFQIPGTNEYLEAWHHPGYFFENYFLAARGLESDPQSTFTEKFNALSTPDKIAAAQSLGSAGAGAVDGAGTYITYFALDHEITPSGAVLNGQGEVVNYVPTVWVADKMAADLLKGVTDSFLVVYDTGGALSTAFGNVASAISSLMMVGKDALGNITSVFSVLDNIPSSLDGLKNALFSQTTIDGEFSAGQFVDFHIFGNSTGESYNFTADPHSSWSGGTNPGWVEDGIQLEIGTGFQSAMESFRSALADAPTIGDPLVVDLDNDGYELTNSRTSEVYFDFNGDSIGERTGWVAPDDGFLALDKNSNGAIDDVSELFGNLTMTGFAELATHDETVNGGNADGLINSTDGVFADLRIWQDINSNGVTDTGELKTLAQWGITQISLTTTELGQTIAGNLLAREANFADSQAVDKSIGEVYFNIDFFDNDMVSGAGTVFGTNPDLLALPLSRGYGEVISLQKAMETDVTLHGLVEDLVEFPVTANSAQPLADLVTDILFRWTGADQVSQDPNALIDPRKVAAMEAFFAMDVDDLLNGQPITQEIASGMEAAWDQLHDMFAARLLFQGPLNSLTPNAHYDFVNDTMKLNASLGQIFNAFEASGWKSEAMAELLYEMLNISGAIDPNVPTPNEAYVLFGDYDTSWIFPAPDSIAGNLKAINGTSGAETLSGWAGGDIVRAGDGNDTLSTPSSSTAGWIVNGVNVTTTYNATNYHHFMYGDAGADTITGAYGWVHGFGGAGNDRLTSSVNDKGATLHGGADNDIVISANANDLLFGGTGDDSISSGSGNDQLYGGDGQDTLNAGTGNDLLHGGAGNDVLTASNGLSYLDGGTGNNSFTVTSSEVTVLAGAGNDTVSAGGFIGHSTIDLGDGINVIDRTGSTSPSGTVSIVTGTGADFIRFYASASTVSSGAGNDSIYGGNGADSIDAGDGDDIITYVHSVGANHTIYGGAGNDSITSGLGNDSILGGDGADTISGGGGVDTIYAGTGDDRVAITAAVQAGNSVIDLGAGKNILSQSGTVSLSATANMYITAGDEGDSITYGRSKATVVGGLGADTITTGVGADYVVGGDGIDLISVSDGNNTVYGGAGGDSITASSGSDLIYGDNGNDTIIGGSGTNTIYGGEGNDSIHLSGLLIVDAGSGDDTVTISAALTAGNSSVILGAGKNVLAQTGTVSLLATASMTIQTGDEGDSITYGRSKATIIGGLGDDTIVSGTGADSIEAGGGHDTINANGGNNTVYGGVGNDSITGGSNADIIYGGDGNDTITGLGGNDSLYGGDGNDTFEVNGLFLVDAGVGDDLVTISVSVAAGSSSIDLGAGKNVLAQTGSVTLLSTASMTITAGDEGDSITYGRSKATITGGQGNDTISSGMGADSISAGSGHDIITSTGGNDTIYGGIGNDSITTASGIDLIYGGDGNDTIVGGDPSFDQGDSLYGGDGNDSVSGGYGNDLLVGEVGNDTLAGGTQNDTINGGAGADVLTGGYGSDRFLYTTIADSTSLSRDNVMDFTQSEDVIDLTSLGFTAIQSGTANGSLLGFTFVNGNTVITADGVDFVIELIGQITLTNADFVF